MMKIITWLKAKFANFSYIGLLFGGLLFALSLTPSLIPRSFIFQGVLGGICFALGYGTGIFSNWLWRFLELPLFKGQTLRALKIAITIIIAILIIYGLWRSVFWQNSIRQLMDMKLLVSSNAILVALIASILAFILIIIAQYIYNLTSYANNKLKKFLPRRLAQVIGMVIITLLVINVINGLLARSVLQVMDASYQKLDHLFDSGTTAPTLDTATGSPNSLVKWENLGRLGRSFITTGPTKADIAAFSNDTAIQPLRIYVGLNSADSAAKRAELALQEMLRVDAFSRKILIIATPTGTGWVDPMGANPIEYIHNGNVATVSMQYSYLASWLSLLAEPERSANSAKALFNAVYNHWTNLPKATRPKLYLNGLSLGSHGSEQSASPLTMIADPIDGALWAGPPFANKLWREITDARNPDSPAWLPKFGDGSIIRFTSQIDHLNIKGAKWGKLRIVYLQHASDPIVFFDMQSAFRQPDWMIGKRGPDVSPEFKWYPIVTFVQTLLDMATAILPPLGYGHTYEPDGYIDGWLQVTNPDNWNDEKTKKLKQHFATQVKHE